MILLDTSAVLAFLWREPGHERVAETMDRAAICSVNLGELVAKLVDRGASDEDCAAIVGALALDVRGFDGAVAMRAGALRRTTRPRGLSLGDRACLACAEAEQAEAVLTADRAWGELAGATPVELIR